MKRPRAIVVAVVGVLIVVAIALFVLSPWADPLHQSAEQVVRNAGVPTSVTPGAPRD